MNLVLFLNKDLEANISYNLLKPELLKHKVRIYYSDSVGNPKNKPSDLLALEYFEKEFFFNELPEFISKNKMESSFEFFDQNFSSFPIEKCANINSKEFIQEMEDFNPDLFISIRFGKIFKDEISQVPTKGLLNLHSAILPDYRGIMGTLHAIKQEKDTIGCTLHTIPNSGIDTGEIIEIAKLEINRSKSLFGHIVQLYPLGTDLIIKSLKKMERDGSLETQEQNLQQGNYFTVPTENDFDQIKHLGMEIISVKDYQDILTVFILKNLSKIQKHHLKEWMISSFTDEMHSSRLLKV
ncbi:formyltransferase family protein [Mesonia sp.]|uniref:formyltransferase family protein n=1 Tax=Mesonia sp. TaxID=1960830 RepID=UPI003F9C6606